MEECTKNWHDHRHCSSEYDFPKMAQYNSVRRASARQNASVLKKMYQRSVKKISSKSKVVSGKLQGCGKSQEHLKSCARKLQGFLKKVLKVAKEILKGNFMVFLGVIHSYFLRVSKVFQASFVL